MRTHSRRSLSRQLLPYLLALFTACSILVFTASAALADTVEIYDDSHVLNISQVRSDASSLSDPIRIYTTRDDANSNSAFDQVTKQKISTTHTLVIAINTLSRHLAIVGGSSVGLSSSQYQDAINAFTSHFSSGGYTGATIAAIDSLKSALKGSGFGSVLLGALCCVGLLLIVGISVFAFVRRRRGGGNVAPVYNAPNQNFGPNYGPGPYPQQPYPQQGGVNPWVAGGLGAAGGGVVGYELGKMEGEREARREMEGQGYYGGGNFGDAGGFGGGASGNFGGGGDNFGGGNSGGDNFGGGNFGGGGDNFGGGGGGDNFGGGGGGDNFGGGNNGGGGNF